MLVLNQLILIRFRQVGAHGDVNAYEIVKSGPIDTERNASNSLGYFDGITFAGQKCILSCGRTYLLH